MPRTRLELARANAHYPLKVACLPISPPGPLYLCVFTAKKVCKYRYYFVNCKIFFKKTSPKHNILQKVFKFVKTCYFYAESVSLFPNCKRGTYSAERISRHSPVSYLFKYGRAVARFSSIFSTTYNSKIRFRHHALFLLITIEVRMAILYGANVLPNYT